MGSELRRVEALRSYCVGKVSGIADYRSVNWMVGITNGVIGFSPHLLTLAVSTMAGMMVWGLYKRGRLLPDFMSIEIRDCFGLLVFCYYIYTN